MTHFIISENEQETVKVDFGCFYAELNHSNSEDQKSLEYLYLVGEKYPVLPESNYNKNNERNNTFDIVEDDNQNMSIIPSVTTNKIKENNLEEEKINPPCSDEVPAKPKHNIVVEENEETEEIPLENQNKCYENISKNKEISTQFKPEEKKNSQPSPTFTHEESEPQIQHKKPINSRKLPKYFDKLEKDYSSKYAKIPICNIFGKNLKIKRRYKRDLIRKRIKSRLFKVLKINLNGKIRIKINKFISSKKLFELPQSMITNMAKDENKKLLGKKLKEILANEGYKPKEIDKSKGKDKSKYDKNQKILIALEKNEINELDEILEEKLEDIYKDYLNSDQFQNAIQELIQKGEKYEYIHNYIETAKGFVNYYNSYDEQKSKKKKTLPLEEMENNC